MGSSPKLMIKKYFGSASIQQMTVDLEEAKGFMEYFWNQDGSGVVVSIDGQKINSYDELVSIVSQDRYKGLDFVEVGLFLSNDGKKSIWPNRS